MRLVNIFQPTVKPSRNWLKNGGVLTSCYSLEVPVVFVEGEPMFLLEPKSQGRQFLVTWYLAHLEKSLEAVNEGVASIDVPASNLEGEAGLRLV